MEDNAPSPNDAEKKLKDGSVTEPEFASYYAAAASAAVSGHTFSAEEPAAAASDAGSSPDAPSSDASSAQVSSDAVQAQAETHDAQTPDEAETSADISDDGSPHGPLDLFSDEKNEETSEQEGAPSGQEEEGTESQEPGQNAPGDSDNAPVIAAFQTPEKQEERTPQVQEEDEDEEEEGAEDDVPMSIIGHLNELRRRLFRIVIIVILGFVAFYGVSEPLYGFLSAPLQACMPEGSKLIYTSPQGAFFTYMKVALVAGLLVASPYLLYVMFRFVSPALYDSERRVSVRLVGAAYAMFLTGVGANYAVVFPLTVRFLGTYQVSPGVENMLTLSSYVDTLLMMSLVFGVVFEIPVVSWLLARFGMLRAAWMRRFRRHAVVAILIVAAVITPTSDVFTLLIVSLPIWLLYEVSILLVRSAEGRGGRAETETTNT